MSIFETIESASDIRKREYEKNNPSASPSKRRIPSTIRVSENVPSAKIRILHVLTSIDLSGMQAHIMNLYRNFDRTHIQFDFLIPRDPTPTGKEFPSSDELLRHRRAGFFDAEITRLGGRVYAIPTYNSNNLFGYTELVNSFFAQHEGEWKIVEGHMYSAASIYLPLAKRHGAITIMHVGSVIDAELVQKIRRANLTAPILKEDCADICFASSIGAARAIFGDIAVDARRIHVIQDGINIQNFLYNGKIRDAFRDKLGLDKTYVFGCVAQFHKNQNHEFLFHVFAWMQKILKEDPTGEYDMLKGLPMKLLLIGDGEEIMHAAQVAAELGIIGQVLFLGTWGNVYDFYQIMDFFIYPANVNGAPAALMEAQVSGLPCVASDTISKDINLTGLINYYPLTESPESWAYHILDELVKMGVVAPAGSGDDGYYDYDTLMNLHRLLSGSDDANTGSGFDQKSYLLNRSASPKMVERIFKNAGLNIEQEVAFMTRLYQNIGAPAPDKEKERTT